MALIDVRAAFSAPGLRDAPLEVLGSALALALLPAERGSWVGGSVCTADSFCSPSLQKALTSLGREGELDRGQCRRLSAPGNCSALKFLN